MFEAIKRLMRSDGANEKLARREPWPMEQPLYAFGSDAKGKPVDYLTIGDLYEGTMVLGRSGSGKTSSTGRALLLATGAAQYAMVITTAKPGDAREVRDFLAQVGREKDIIEVNPQSGNFNFLQYWSDMGADTGQLVEMLMTIAGTSSRAGRANQDDIWSKAMREWLANALDLLRLAGQPLSMSYLAALAKTSAQTREEAESGEWRRTSTVAYCLKEAKTREEAGDFTASQTADLELCGRYWLHELPGMADRTRSSIEMTTNATLAPFARGWLRDRFCGGTADITPEALESGKILLLNYPVKEHQEAGQLAQTAWKLMVQRWVERRAITPETRPLLLFSDECQFFLTREDVQFQTTARSSRTATVYLTQNRPNVVKELGDEKEADSLFGNLATKIFHCNDERTTNEWAAYTIGQNLVYRKSDGTSGGQSGFGFNTGRSEQRDFEVAPSDFLSLRTGGPQNGLHCEAVLFRSGRFWSNGKHHRLVTIPQT